MTTATSPSTVQRGYQVKRVGYTFNGWDGSHKIGPGVDAELKNGATYTATWKANDYAVTFDANGGSGGQSEQVTATYDSDMPDISSEKPKRDGYTFMGWYDNADYAASGSKQYYTAEGKSARKYDKAGTCKLYAGWSAYPTMTIEGNGGLLGVTIDQANANADGSHHVGEVIAQNQESWTVGFLSAAAYPSIIHYWRDNYLHAIRAQRVGYTQTGWGGTITVNASTGSIGIGDGYRLAAEWTANRYSILLDAQDGSEAETINATYDADVTLPEPKKQGSIFHGWNTEPDGSGERYGAGIALSKPNLTAEANGSVTLYAQWMSTLSVDVPLEVTAQVDLLGLEEQVEATGWIESRSGGALKVAEVSFTPLGGATELFGSRTADVFLEAFAEGSTSADVSFALDAADAESDPDRLVPFALPDGYGTRIGVGYRFVIPDEVLSSIDPSRFEQATTPVGQVVYTVALAS